MCKCPLSLELARHLFGCGYHTLPSLMLAMAEDLDTGHFRSFSLLYRTFTLTFLLCCELPMFAGCCGRFGCCGENLKRVIALGKELKSRINTLLGPDAVSSLALRYLSA
jgi:hypothetical protein